MTSPISALADHIIHAFENPNGSAVELLREAVSEGIFNPELDLATDSGPPRGPRAIRCAQQPAYIAIHVPHLELLWAFTYGWVVLYEEAVQRPLIEGNFDGRIMLATGLTARAAELLQWASELRISYTRWPVGLPSPMHAASPQEQEYASKVSKIFRYATAFMLYHEFGHIRQGHICAVEPGNTDPGARATAIQLEREADDYAFGALVAYHDSEDDRMLKGWAILTPALSSLYLIDGRAGLIQCRHPPLHHRIADLLAKLNFVNSRHRSYFNYLCATVLRTFDRAYRDTGGATLTPHVFSTGDEAFEAEMSELDHFLSAPSPCLQRHGRTTGTGSS